MWELAVGDYVRHGKRNVFMALQVSLLLFVVIIMMATLHEEYYLYRPIADFSEKKGVVYQNTGYHANQVKQLTYGMEQIEDVLTYGSVGFFDEEKDTYCSGGVYADSLINQFAPDLAEGKWLDTDNNDGVLAVVSKNNQGWKTGDTINLVYMDVKQNEKKMRVKICGVLREGALIFGRNLGQGGEYHHDYRDLYSIFRFQQEQSPLLLFREEELSREGVPVDYGGSYLVSYKEGTTEKQSRQNEAQMLENGKAAVHGAGETQIASLGKFSDNSRREIMRNLMMYLPVVFTILLMTAVSVVNVCVLNMKESYRQNAVIYLLGLGWKRCSLFTIIQDVVTVLLASLLAAVYFCLIKIFKWDSFLCTEIYGETYVVLFFIVLLLFAVTFFIVRGMLRKREPVEILRQEGV